MSAYIQHIMSTFFLNPTWKTNFSFIPCTARTPLVRNKSAPLAFNIHPSHSFNFCWFTSPLTWKPQELTRSSCWCSASSFRKPSSISKILKTNAGKHKFKRPDPNCDNNHVQNITQKNSQTVKLNCLIKKQLIHDWRFAIHRPGELVWVMASENDHHRTVASDVDSKTNKHVESGEALMAITKLTFFFSILSRRRFVKRPVFPEWFPTNLLARLTQNSVWKAKKKKARLAPWLNLLWKQLPKRYHAMDPSI